MKEINITTEIKTFRATILVFRPFFEEWQKVKRIFSRNEIVLIRGFIQNHFEHKNSTGECTEQEAMLANGISKKLVEHFIDYQNFVRGKFLKMLHTLTGEKDPQTIGKTPIAELKIRPSQTINLKGISIHCCDDLFESKQKARWRSINKFKQFQLFTVNLHMALKEKDGSR